MEEQNEEKKDLNAQAEGEQAPENSTEQNTTENPEKAQEAAKAETKEEKQPSPEEIIAQLNDKYLRLRADFDNYRKRMAREADETRERSKMIVVSDFLPVYDFFMMAMNHSEHTDDINALKQGLQMILSEFKRAFDGLGVKEIIATGKEFDPKFHEAMKTENSDTVPEGVVISQWKSGYMIGDRLIRPATVVVSAGPAKAEEAPKAEEVSDDNEAPKADEAPHA